MGRGDAAVEGAEAASHGTSYVDECVARGAAVVAVLGHGEQVWCGEGPGVGGSRSLCSWGRGSLARIVVSSEPQRAAETCAPHDERRSKRPPSTIVADVRSDEASFGGPEPPLWSGHGQTLRHITHVGPRVYPGGDENDGEE